MINPKQLYRLAILFTLLANPFHQAFAQFNQVPDSLEYQALVDLYNSTNGENWDNNSNWLSGGTINDMASWYGVTVQNGDVRKISLAVNNLTGELPTSIENLKLLDWLHLGANGIEGSIPSQIGNLNALTRLYLNNNNFSGTIPKSIKDLNKLTHLYLQFNNLTGSIPSDIGNLNRLQNLYLFDNALSGSIPTSFEELRELRMLNLENNDLTGEIPENIGNLIQLTNLALRNNALTGSIPASITKCVNLKFLYLNHNSLAGSIPSDIDKLSQLEVLCLERNLLTGIIPESIGSLPNLRNFMLDGNKLTGSIPESIGNCVNLVHLYLQFNNLTGNLPSSLGNLKKVSNFFASSNQLNGPIPDSLGQMINLIGLRLNDNNLSGPLPPSITNLKKLQRLRVHNNQFEGPIPEGLNKFENLNDLMLYENKFTTFPDFSAHPKSHLINARFPRNQIKFQDIERNFTGPGSHIFSSISYHTQTSQPADTLGFTLEQSVILEAEDHAPHNKFQWQKLLDGRWTDIAGATSGIYNSSSISLSDATSYRCRITNDWVTGLTIYSRIFVLQTTSEFWSVADGNWTTDRIWSTTKGGVAITGYPQSGSKVYIVGNNITLNTNLSCGPLEVIVENSAASLTIDGAEMTVQGEVKLTKTTEGYPGSIKVVNGGRVRPVEE